MKREIKVVSGDLVQITLEDDRWYAKTIEGGQTVYVPSVSWICNYTPVTEGLLRWYAKLGWEGAMEVLSESADRGTRVHAAVSALIDGEEVRHDSLFLTDGDNGEAQELSRREWEAVLSFADWWKYADVQHVYYREKTVWGEGYAGTLDLLCYCGEPQKAPRARTPAARPGLNLIDFKTGKEVYPSHIAQVAAYRKALKPPDNLNGNADKVWQEVNCAILQLGYSRNARGWKYNAVPYQPELFEAAFTFWKQDNEGATPHSYELPVSVKLVDKTLQNTD